MTLEKVNSTQTSNEKKKGKEKYKDHRNKSSCRSYIFAPFTKCISSGSSKGESHGHEEKKEDEKVTHDGGSYTDYKSSSEEETDHDHHQLPSLDEWPNRPIYIQAAEDTECFSSDCDCYVDGLSSIPIGVPVHFESSLFKGKILIRVRNIPIPEKHQYHCHDSDNGDQFRTNPATTTKNNHKNKKNKKEQEFHDEEYFKHKKRMRQYVIQGQFKEEIPMSDVYIGDYYDRKLGMVPPPFIEKVLKAAFRQLQPGVIMDLTAEKPKVVVLMAGAVKTMSIDRLGEEPDITLFDLPENTKLIEIKAEKENEIGIETKYTSGGFPSPDARRKLLSNPQNASKYTFHPGKVYTFNNYDDVFDLSTYRLCMPGMKKKLELSKILNGQPTTIRASRTDGTSLFNFSVFHESTRGTASEST